MTLIEAVKHGHVDAARLLLDQGADPNVREVVLTKPSLTHQIEGGQPTMADTALMIAAQEGHTEIVKLLLDKGADVNGRGVAGYTPLMEVIRRSRADVAKLLLEHSARPNQQNDSGDTAILFAANLGQAEAISLLLDHGADINGGGGQPPLMMAVETGHKDVVKLLISRGADVNRRRNGLWTTLEWALLLDRAEIAALIREAGGKGRSLDVLRKAMERAIKEWEVEHPANPQPESRDRVLTEDDQQVIETVLLDLLAYRGPDLPFTDTANPDIILIDKTAVAIAFLSDDQMNGELDDKQANDVSLEIREHTLQRNAEPTSLAEFKSTSPHIRLESEDAVPTRSRGFREEALQARAWVKVWLPGYSKSRDRVLLRFGLGPSAHSATGTYFLIKQEGAWQVQWRRFAFYA